MAALQASRLGRRTTTYTPNTALHHLPLAFHKVENSILWVNLHRSISTRRKKSRIAMSWISCLLSTACYIRESINRGLFVNHKRCLHLDLASHRGVLVLWDNGPRNSVVFVNWWIVWLRLRWPGSGAGSNSKLCPWTISQLTVAIGGMETHLDDTERQSYNVIRTWPALSSCFSHFEKITWWRLDFRCSNKILLHTYFVDPMHRCSPQSSPL